MKRYGHKIGITLIEMLVVVAIIVMLASITISVATRVDNQAKERLIENTFTLLNTALQQFSDYKFQYNKDDLDYPGGQAERNFYVGLDFPIDCNGFSEAGLQAELAKVLNKTVVINPVGAAVHAPNYSSGEAFYLFLSRVPECRKTLDKIDASLITNLDFAKQPINIDIDGRFYPLLRVIDPWGRALYYDYYNEGALTLLDMELSKRNFPLLISAGPDRIFGTFDDMANK